MGAPCDLRYHAAVDRVLSDLAVNFRGEHSASALDDGGSGLVTRGLDTEDELAQALSSLRAVRPAAKPRQLLVVGPLDQMGGARCR